MKNIKLFILISLVVSLFSCETYSDPEIKHSPVYPISGQWYVNVYDAATDTLVKPQAAAYTLYTYDVASGVADSLWVSMTSSSAPTGAFRGKIGCSVTNLTFSGANVAQYPSPATPYSFSITNGLLKINGGKTLSGFDADVISFTITSTLKPGKTFKVKEVRVSGWPEDIPH